MSSFNVLNGSSRLSRSSRSRNELPRSKLTGYQNIAMRIYPKGFTPECFNRGPARSHAGGSSSGLAWIPDRSIRE